MSDGRPGRRAPSESAGREPERDRPPAGERDGGRDSRDSAPSAPDRGSTSHGDDGRHPEPDSKRTRLRTISSIGTFILLLGFALYLTRGIVLPVVLALLLKFLLTPVVRLLRRLHVKESIGAGIVLLGLLTLLGLGLWRLAEPANRWAERAPQTLESLEGALRGIRVPAEKLGEATQQVQAMTSIDQAGPDSTEVTIRTAPLAQALLSTTTGVIGGFFVLVVLLYFLLAAGDAFLRKLVGLMPRLSSKKETVHVFRELERDLSRYLLAVTLINAGLGAVVALAMHLLGMPNPVLWGVMAGLLNFIPYLGALVSAGVLTLLAVTIFPDDTLRVLMVPGVFMVLNIVESYFLTPIVLGRRLMLNPVAIFLGVLFWGWLWSVPGALLAVPILVAVKILCVHVPSLRPVSEFLGAYSEDRERPLPGPGGDGAGA